MLPDEICRDRFVYNDDQLACMYMNYLGGHTYYLHVYPHLHVYNIIKLFTILINWIVYTEIHVYNI